MKRLIFYLCVCSLSSGCSHYVLNETGFARPPKNYHFSYQNQVSQLRSTEVIDTTAIYFLHDDKNYDLGNAYIRFYADGHYKTQGIKSYPVIEEVNNHAYGIVGYYILQGNTVKMQVYTDVNGGSNQLEFGFVDDKKNLVVLHQNPRSTYKAGFSERAMKRKAANGKTPPLVYEKIKMEGLTYNQPNW
jgi:hypothetical protein